MHLFEHRRKEMPVNGIDGGDAHMPAPQPEQIVQLLADPGKVLFPVIGRVQEQPPRRRSALNPVGWRSKSGIASSCSTRKI